MAPPPPGLAALASEVLGQGPEEITAAEIEAEDVEAPAVEEAPPQNASYTKTETSGLAPHDDQELLRLFQEIESDYSNRNADPAREEDSDDERQERISTVTLADIYISQGQIHRAVEIYQKILVVEPENEEIRQRLARLQ